jgi:hypothetical protein
VKFCAQTGIGITCTSPDPEQIIKAISNLLCDKELYRQTMMNVFKAREDYLSLSVMKRQFARFLGVDQTVLNDAE